MRSILCIVPGIDSYRFSNRVAERKACTAGAVAERRAVIFMLVILPFFLVLNYFRLCFLIAPGKRAVCTGQAGKTQYKESHYECEEFHRL